jgi:virginiamycin B lyase
MRGRYVRRFIGAAIILLVTPVALGAQRAAHASAGRVTLLPLSTDCGNPFGACGPSGISAGPDGNMWFTLFEGNSIGRISRDQIRGSNSTRYDITLFNLPTTCGRPTRGPSYGCGPQSIVAGSDGALWFTEEIGNKIGRMTTSGVVTEYSLPHPQSHPGDITAGPDGALWFTEPFGDRIGRITTAGSITEYQLANGSFPFGIAKGPDNALWFTEEGTLVSDAPPTCVNNNIGRITITGAIKEYPIPTACASAGDIATGPGNALYFTEFTWNKVGRLTTAGHFGELKVDSPGAGLNSITRGPDDNLWFTEVYAGDVGRMTPAGATDEFSLTPVSFPSDAASGPNSGVWFTESGNNTIGYVIP